MRKRMLMMVAGVMMIAMTACGAADTLENRDNIPNDIADKETVEIDAESNENNEFTSLGHNTNGAYAYENMVWQYIDEETGKNVRINITPKDEKSALIIVSENSGTGRMWTFNNCVYDEEAITFTVDTSEFVATVADEKGNMSVFEVNDSVFTILDNSCTWSDAERIFGEDVKFDLLFEE